KAEDASRLATAGLQQFGGMDAGPELAKLKREADALTAAQADDSAARRGRFRQEGDAALQEKNLRAAAIAFEQVLQLGDDPILRRQLEDIQATLVRYDDNRRRAAELRRDPANLEEAIAALQEAARAWDTLQVRQEIDEYTLALQKRRDRISVADFEIRDDIGLPAAGRTIAEELLPAFKPRFNLVERSQLGKVIAELRLEAGDLAENDAGRQELGRLARVRYLVIGSVTPFCGITVNARLVDVRTGLIVQTAKIVVRTPDEIVPRLPQLAAMLMMSDEQEIAYGAQLAQQTAVEFRPIVIAATLPPPPEPPVLSQPLPPPIVVYTPRPPELGGVVVADFERLPSRGLSFSLAIE